MTTREFLNAVIEANISDELNDQAKAMVAALDKRNAKRAATPSKTAIANVPLKHAIVTLFTDEVKTLTASEVSAHLEVSTQKASALLRQMVEGGFLTVEEVKVPKKGKVKAYSLVG